MVYEQQECKIRHFLHLTFFLRRIFVQYLTMQQQKQLYSRQLAEHTWRQWDSAVRDQKLKGRDESKPKVKDRSDGAQETNEGDDTNKKGLQVIDYALQSRRPGGNREDS
ncbi:hypothetical protein BDQ17DRAFT_8234 [Cyathus striatus]|nr:hypothetical protein BDQ17DRAFT_8234 [Cyathus striatus]